MKHGRGHETRILRNINMTLHQFQKRLGYNL
jgi:hypothetical protein